MSDQQLELATLSRLQPGDLVFNAEESAVFLTATTHPIPLYGGRGLSLVLWRMNDGRLQMDCLTPYQEVGKRLVQTHSERLDRLAKAFFDHD